ncbi:hypothetical protein SAMN05444166_4431 [Singulisphaera sp. GP187]|uniref:hypothetical protein n=1 Tax=Singulisphaera sp. GP187 TaxID=1882752 RepID=UPI000925FC3B|nr:hypothetical protein [Singulisphaera sp. GP187]SIO40513.1 hypothetical protein SAMN05444166_4431 [Singulisphaera sp. GP187]
MATVKVDLSGLDAYWIKACKRAVTDLNVLFKKSDINVVLALGSSTGPTITVTTDSTISGTAVHGRTAATTSDSGQLQSAEVKLPVEVRINTPGGLRGAGLGVLEVIAAHEFVHALGQVKHNSHLMAQTWTKLSGDTPAGDKLQEGGLSMPPLALAPESVEKLKAIWG